MTEEPRRGRPDDEDIDARFAEIIAGLDLSTHREQAPGSVPAEPEEPETPDTPGDDEPPAATTAEDPQEAEPAPGAAPTAWREWSEPDVEEHFVPPDPPPLPAGDLHFWGIVVGLLGGPLILFLAHGLGVLDDPLWSWLGLGLSLGGFALLVLRLPTRRDDDPSGGARV